jgi:hypothetical protein
MAFDYTSLSISGFQGQALPNTLLKQKGNPHHLALLFPGLNYSAAMPILYYPGRILVDHGADLLQVEYTYNRQPGFSTLSDTDQAAWLRADAEAALEAALAQRSYQHITLIGKSIGTLSMGELVESHPRLAEARCIWLTPLLTNERLYAQIRRGGQCGLFVTGTADAYYRPERLNHLVQITCSSSLVIAGADHSLEIPGNIWATLTALNELLRAVDEFVS